MKILVTGGLGFIGSNFCRHIIKKHSDARIINLDKIGIGANPANLQDLGDQERYSFIKGDICNSQPLTKTIKQVDAVVNFAAETHVDRSIAEPTAFIQNNTFGTFNILENIRKNNPKARFVQVSTDEVYGEIKEGAFKETDTLKPSNPYSASKAASDHFTLAYCKTYSLNTSITRCTNNYGPYQFPEKLIPKTIIRALQNLPIPIYGSGKNIRDWIYVQDHCEAIDLVLAKGKPGEIYNISAENELTNTQIAIRILKLLNKPEDAIAFVEDRPGHDMRYSLNSSKIRKELGWKPKHDFQEALKATVNWYAKSEQWWKPLAKEPVLHPTPWKLK